MGSWQRRQNQLKQRSTAGVVRRLNMAAKAYSNLLNNRQAKATSRAHRSGTGRIAAIKALEQMLLIL